MALQQYKSDGGYDFSRLWIFILTGLSLGIPSALAVEAISLYAECWWPIKAALIAVYGLVLGGFLHVAGSSAKNRNSTVHTACSLLITALLLYFQWLAYFNLARWHATPSGQWPVWITDPRDLWAQMVVRAQTGAFATTASASIGWTIGELVLWVAWGVEALWILFLPITVGRDYINDPFYPQINDWGKKTALPSHYALPAGITEAQQILADDRFQWLRQLAPTDQPEFLLIEITEQRDQPVSYFTLITVTTKTNSKGQTTLQRQTLVNNVELSREQRQDFDQLQQEAAQRSPAPAIPGEGSAENPPATAAADGSALADAEGDEDADAARRAEAADDAADPDAESATLDESNAADRTTGPYSLRPAPAAAADEADPYARPDITAAAKPAAKSQTAPPAAKAPAPIEGLNVKLEDIWDE